MSNPQPPAAKELTVITSHLNPDYDALASMVAASKLYPEAILVWPGGPEKSLKHFFIKSLAYFLKTAKAQELDLDQVKTLILVDTRQANRLGDLSKVLKNPGLEIHIYDHHPQSPDDLRGTLEVIEPLGATVTLMTEIIERRSLPLNPEEATMLALGIYEDTGSLSFTSTTPRDLRAAAFLLEKGAVLSTVNDLMVRELDSSQLALFNELLRTIQVRKIGSVNVHIAMGQVEHYIDDVAILAHKIMDISGAGALFVLVGMENRVQLVARSRAPEIDVGLVARNFGGGGHASAAAATIKGFVLSEARAQLETLLATALAPVRRARDIMVFPVISAAPETQLSEARELMFKYGINVLLITNDLNEPLGFITQQSVGKALHHRVAEYPVKTFMTTEFRTVSPEATFSEIQAVIIDLHQRLLPVVENETVVGVITRTDLLHIMANDLSLPEPLNPLEQSGRHKQINALISENLPADIVNFLMEAGRTALELDMSAFAVGGFVRDLIRREANKDIDLAIEGDALVFAEALLTRYPGMAISRHPKFQTATLTLNNGYKIDLSTTRLEYYEHPGALPVVRKGSIILDLYRRDFTINTLALSLSPNDFGTLIDHYRGLKDLKDGYIRVLHNFSFVEDPTRVFRAIRFAARLGFKISKMTQTLLENAVENGFLSRLSGYRLKHELKLILEEDKPAPALEHLERFGVLEYIHPKIRYDRKLSEQFKKAGQVYDWRRLAFEQEEPGFWLVYLAVLTGYLAGDELVELARKLSLTKAESQFLIEEKPRVEELVHLLKRDYKNRPPKPSQVYEALKGLSPVGELLLMARLDNPDLSRAVGAFLTIRRKALNFRVTGQDLVDLGYPKGPQCSETLDVLFKKKLDGDFASKEDELTWVKENLPLVNGGKGGRGGIKHP